MKAGQANPDRTSTTTESPKAEVGNRRQFDVRLVDWEASAGSCQRRAVAGLSVLFIRPWRLGRKLSLRSDLKRARSGPLAGLSASQA